MKRITMILLVCFAMAACSKSEDGPKEVTPRIELDLAKLNAYIGQSFDEVNKSLEKNAYSIKTTDGNRSFTVSANSGEHKGLSIEIQESPKKTVLDIFISYKGAVGGKSIGDPYENELWYDMLMKVQGVYGQSSTKAYIKDSLITILTSNEALAQHVKDNGYKDASFAATWNSTPNTIRVAHSDEGKFFLQIRANYGLKNR